MNPSFLFTIMVKEAVMGLLSGGISFRRFRVHSKLPENFRDEFLGSISGLTFQEQLDSRSKEPVFGWVNVFDPDDTEFELNKVLFDRYLVLGMRMDKKAINGKLLQILLERRFRAVKAERGVERLGKKHKEEIREALEEDLLGKSLPSVNTYDLSWDIHTGEVLMFASSESVQDLFQGLFHDTFAMPLYPERLVDWVAEDMSWDEIESRTEAHVIGGASDKGKVAEDGWHEGNTLKGREMLLGSEFLTWLWRESELKDGHFRISPPDRSGNLTGKAAITEREGEDLVEDGVAFETVTRKGGEDDEVFTLWLDTKLTFRDLDDIDHPGVTTMVGSAPSATPEARLSLSSGKKPVEARLGLRRGDQEWFFTLRVGTAGLELSGMKLPFEVKDGEEEKIYERMYLLDTLSSVIRGMFRQFFRVRTSDSWPGLIERWLEQDNQT